MIEMCCQSLRPEMDGHVVAVIRATALRRLMDPIQVPESCLVWCKSVVRRFCVILSYLLRLPVWNITLEIRTEVSREVSLVPTLLQTLICHWRCRKHLLPDLDGLDEVLQDEVMLHFARQLPLMGGQGSSLAELVRKLPFVNTASGMRRSPQDLHDPRHAKAFPLLLRPLRRTLCLRAICLRGE